MAKGVSTSGQQVMEGSTTTPVLLTAMLPASTLLPWDLRTRGVPRLTMMSHVLPRWPSPIPITLSVGKANRL